jgi:stress-induced morphogen
LSGSQRVFTQPDSVFAGGTGKIRTGFSLAFSETAKMGAIALAMNGPEIERLIQEAFPEARVIVVDMAGDGDHFAARVTSERFKGKSRVQQHKMVYDALQGRMGGALHALALQTALPE